MVVVIWSMGNHTKLTRLLFNLQRLQAQLSIFFILDLYFVIYYFFLSIKGKILIRVIINTKWLFSNKHINNNTIDS